MRGTPQRLRSPGRERQTHAPTGNRGSGCLPYLARVAFGEEDASQRIRCLTKPNHPWTNGQVERMNRTLKEATVRRYHYATHQQLREHLDAFLDAYNFAKRLKTLRGITPYERVCKACADDPDRFRYDPTHLTSGLNT